ncbi:MAG: EamA family transporter [Nitrososphaeraceae archaeon]|nr:EamA family transporter [Nitrososphaeraceae archaeon]MDW0173994.1 EamA family transporter [Nitrososphaeraceae archaeon]MDW0176424.1 EamA family transporter [Nitrososphaeraceae archaeon]MDW0185132.1 EamA family transporter [Nitrososphaeraceae archaeon]MDW0194590.1 EamA family transporter [Nitrososphaeraceae archaeon]
MLLVLRSWPIFIYALTISAESIFIELLTTTYNLSPIIVSAVSITFAGILLLLIGNLFHRRRKITHIVPRTILIFTKSAKNLLYASVSLAVGIFTWYDSISRVGASKEMLLAGPLEVIFIVILAYIFLQERLDKVHLIGIIVAIVGFFLAVISDINNGNTNFFSLLPYHSIITLGDIEAIVSALGFAVGVLFLTKLVIIHSPLQVAGASLLVSGIILSFFLVVFVSALDHQIPYFSRISVPVYPTAIIALLFFSWLPFIGALSYSIGLSRIGAALTGTIGSSSILLTLVFQVILKQFGLDVNLPQNILIAGLGSVFGFIGIFIVHMRDYNFIKIKRSGRI